MQIEVFLSDWIISDFGFFFLNFLILYNEHELL